MSSDVKLDAFSWKNKITEWEMILGYKGVKKIFVGKEV